jgi:hypothetical protein
MIIDSRSWTAHFARVKAERRARELELQNLIGPVAGIEKWTDEALNKTLDYARKPGKFSAEEQSA